MQLNPINFFCPEEYRNFVFVDASCESWSKTKGESWGVVVIFSSQNAEIILENSKIKDAALKQFINRFEYLAIKRARELYPDALIYSDSKVAIGWAKKHKLGAVRWIPRRRNPAGWYLELAHLFYSQKI